jgi:hypothetical protein
MHVVSQAAQGVEAAKVILVLVAIAVVVFWRAVLRAVLALIAIAILIAVGSGVIELMHRAHL